MDFTNRTAELRRLDALVAAGPPAFAALWGRRRIGKTRLLLEWCRKHDGLYAVADLSAEPVQRRYVAEAMALRFPGFADVEYPDWRTLFRALARDAGRAGWKGPLILDEFPYLVESSPSLPTVLQAFIDHEARDANLLIVVCGSSQRMMQGLVLTPEAPLYGRARESMRLGPMSPGALGEALGIRRSLDCVRAFALWGGVPRYWELAEPFADDVAAAAEHVVLDPAGPLHLEPDRLLVEERPPALAMRPILDAIGGGAHRVSEIAGRLGVPATALAHGLSRLIELELVTREQPFGESGRGGKRSLYRIADPFMRLWFRVVAPHRAALASGTRRTRLALWRAHQQALYAETWEELCRQAVPRLEFRGAARGSRLEWTTAARFWRGNGPEWDVVAESLDGRALLVGEVKWRSAPASGEDLRQLCRQLAAKGLPPVDKDLNHVEVVRAVFVPHAVGSSRTLPDGCRIVTAREVVEALGTE